MEKTRVDRGRRTGSLVLSGLALLLASGVGLPGAPGAAADEREATTARRARNVIVVTLDGLRWQELFSGFSADYNTKEEGGVGDPAAVAGRFDAPSAAARREALMPFLWAVVARDGQILGDPAASSLVRLTNGLRFSYPGYNEMLSGAPDPRVDSNEKITNPNLTVLEWLGSRPGFEGRIAAFGSWDVLPFIVAAERSGIHTNGDGPAVLEPRTDRDRLLNDFTADLPRYWGGSRFDAPTMQGALEYLRTRQPRVLYVMLGETDEWAHGRRYDLYLDAAWRGDRFVRQLWETAQSLPAYRGQTTLLLTTDHGRGETPADWTDHGRDVPAAERIWAAALGPDTPALGVRDGVSGTQSQLAATIAAALGEDFVAASPRAAPPFSGVVDPARATSGPASASRRPGP